VTDEEATMNVHPIIGHEIAVEWHRDLERAMRRRRLLAVARSRQASPRTDVVIRDAVPGDEPALSRLAALEGRARLCGDVLVATVRGAIRAAIAVRGGEVVVDPFQPSADLAALLRLRAQQVRAGRVR